MPTLYVTEYASMGQISGAQMPDESSIQAAYGVNIDIVSTQSPQFQPKTRFIELQPDGTCSIAVGLNPTAVTTARRLPANTDKFVGVPEGGNYKVAVITNA